MADDLPIVSGAKRRTFNYSCDSCLKRVPRSHLFAKHIQWRTMGEGPKVVRGRVVAWECMSCMIKDPDYNRTRFSDSHGFADTILGRQAFMEGTDENGPT